MNKIKERLRRMMEGRYGTDQLNKTMIFSAFLLVIIGMFIQAPIPALIINTLILIIIFISFFRTYSRNISKRNMENKKFRKITKPLRRTFSIQKMRFRERKKSRFRVCPNCRIVIRTSKEKGSRNLTCPRCRTDFKTRIFL